jgi:DNA polymerase elongation subunit (family B)
MLLDYEYKNKKLLISHIDESGSVKLKYFPWNNPTKFVVCSGNDSDKSGKYTTWDGKSVKEAYTTRPNRSSIYDFMDGLPKEEQEMIFNYNEPNIFFIDIENQILDEKISAEKASGEIQTISIVNKDKVLVIGTKPFSSENSESIENDINNYFSKFNTSYKFMYRYYESEYDMLLNLFKNMIPKMPVISGWNVVEYDWVYLVNRARKLGIDPTVASFTNNLREPYLDNSKAELPAHRVVIDYMNLYEKFDTSVKVKESSSLDFVSDNLLGVKKVNYEGNLKYLYESDYYKFVLYNAIDSILVQQIHIKMKYVDILYGISTLSRIRIADAVSTIPVTEGILRKRFREEKNVVFAREEVRSTDNSDDMSVKGGWVKDPIVGMSEWTTCYDFSSLYPTTIRQFNISSDSYKGNLIKDRGKDVMSMISKLRSGEEVYSSFNGHRIELEKDDIVTLNGAVFKNEDGIVKNVMGDIYIERKRYKKMMMDTNIELQELENELEKLKKELG